MALEANVSRRQIEADRASLELYDFLEREQTHLQLEAAKLYYRFPRYRSATGDIVSADVCVASPLHGLLAFVTTDATEQNAQTAIPSADAHCDQAHSAIFARLIQSRGLRRTKSQLVLDFES